MEIYIDPKVPEEIQEIGRKQLAGRKIKAKKVELIYHPGLKQFRVFDVATRQTIDRYGIETETRQTGGTGNDNPVDPGARRTEKKAKKTVRGDDKPATDNVSENTNSE